MDVWSWGFSLRLMVKSSGLHFGLDPGRVLKPSCLLIRQV